MPRGENTITIDCIHHRDTEGRNLEETSLRETFLHLALTVIKKFPPVIIKYVNGSRFVLK